VEASVAAGGYAPGLAASALFDLPDGAVIVCAIAVTSIVTAPLGK
jgi:hypothetical protein